MKTFNKFSAICASLLLFSSLVGCGGGNSGGGNKKPKTDWSDNEKSLLNEHFYGVQEEGLPYFACDGLSELSYDEDYEYLLATGGKPETEYMQSYAQSLVDVGFRNISGTDGNYMYELEIATEDGIRFAIVQYGFFNSKGEVDATFGTFNYIVEDLYVYDWADITDLFTQYNKILEDSGFATCGATLLEPEGSTHFMFLSEYIAYGYFAVYAFGANSESYETTLTNASYSITDTKDSSGNEMTVAINANKDTQIGFYDDKEEDALVLTITPYIPPVAWPSDKINEYLKECDVEADIPSYDSLGEVFFYGHNDDGSFYVTTDGDQTTQDNYNKLVVATGKWTNINDETYTVKDYGYLYVTEDESVEIQFFSYNGTFMLIIYGETNSFKTGDWPTDAINKFLASYDVTETIPALTGKGEVFRYLGVDKSEELDAQFIIVTQDDENKSIEKEYLALVEANDNWESANDNDYTVEDYGYVFLNKANTVQLNFETTYSEENKTYSFMLYIFPLDGTQGENPVTINDIEGGSKLATLDFSKMTKEGELSSFGISKYMTISFSIGTGNNQPKFFLNGLNARMYSGNIMTFTPNTGTTITSIVIDADFSQKQITAEDLGVNNATVEVSGSTVTFTPIDGKEPIEVTINGTGKQLRMLSIQIAFKVA